MWDPSRLDLPRSTREEGALDYLNVQIASEPPIVDYANENQFLWPRDSSPG